MSVVESSWEERKSSNRHNQQAILPSKRVEMIICYPLPHAGYQQDCASKKSRPKAQKSNHKPKKEEKEPSLKFFIHVKSRVKSYNIFSNDDLTWISFELFSSCSNFFQGDDFLRPRSVVRQARPFHVPWEWVTSGYFHLENSRDNDNCVPIALYFTQSALTASPNY